MGVLCKPISRHFYHYGRLFFMVFRPHFFASQKCPDFRVSRWGFCNFTTFLSLWQTFSWFFNPIFCASQKHPDFRISRWRFCVSQFHDISIIMADFFHRVGHYIFHGFSTPFFVRPKNVLILGSVDGGFCVSQFHDISIIMADFFRRVGQYIFHGLSTPFFCVPTLSRF